MAAQLYQARETVRRLLGDKYAAKMAELGEALVVDWGLARALGVGRSDDGKTWQQTGKIEGKMPTKLNVGVVGVNATKLKAEVVFEGFKIVDRK